MRVTVFPCSEAVNESEILAAQHLKRQLQNSAGDDEWVLLTNLAFSVTHQFQSDEIDVIAIGRQGVRVIEVKHWAAGWIEANAAAVEQESDRVTNKARKIGTTLRRIVADLPRVDGAFLLTQPASKLKRISGKLSRGVAFYSLNQWKEVLGLEGPRVLSSNEVTSLSQLLAPKCAVALDGSLRRLAGYVNLELQTPKDQRFHRVYKGSHPARRDRVILHLYDLSASDDGNAEARARREAEALQRLQLYAWAPRMLDSWQDAPGYAGEMYFFTVVDPAAPSISERADDETWKPSTRLQFSRDAIRALAELHQSGGEDGTLVHRNLTPRTILVRHDNSPIFTGFERTKIPSDISVASSSAPVTDYPESVAPELRTQGLVAADQRSDVYALCTCLSGLFVKQSDSLSAKAIEVLSSGSVDAPEKRRSLREIEQSLSLLLGDSVIPPPAPPARFWTEDQVVRFNGRDYRIISRLGSGGVGTTFKVVEIDRSTKEDLGTYVAKVAYHSEVGKRVLKAYSLVRSHLGRHDALSPIYESALDWQENQFIALLGWIEGTPLSEFTGVFPLLADEQEEISAEALGIRFLQRICEGLDILHRNGLTHGDVSPRNLIVSGNSLVLTDYDFVTRIGEVASAPGTVTFCSPSREQKQLSTPRDDLFALAATFFEVLFEKQPFRYDGNLDKDRGLNWGEVNRKEYPLLAEVLDKATHSDPALRFSSAAEMLGALRTDHSSNDKDAADRLSTTSPTVRQFRDVKCTRESLSEQRVDWLKPLLQSYPGSCWGNQETRGLDTQFAIETYVSTPLEESLLDDIRSCRVRLVILCGNAGDGKTALLQHLGEKLGLGRHPSADRILEGQVPNGPQVRMNLDGSASWRGKTADEILDEFLEPFQSGPPRDNIVHLLAINDGRLLEWIDGVEGRLGNQTPLTDELYRLLQQEAAVRESHIRFINLNQRSLVGGITADRLRIKTGFLEDLLDHLYGGEKAADFWSVCRSCSAKDRCSVIQAACVFGPLTIKSPLSDETRKRARQRLFDLLQAVHLRGETHITVRELRAALVYVLFGVHFCNDYHNDGNSPKMLPYWDRAFAAESPARQGEVLKELARYDPALESHPQIDRFILSRPTIDRSCATPHFRDLSLESARRRAYFEWTEKDLEQVANDTEALDLSRGRHLKLFRELALKQEAKKLSEITRRLCSGISRLEDLPPQSLERQGVVPLRITPRTPTETAFWVEKPLERFRISADLPLDSEGIERLHRQVTLVYQYRDGKDEKLRLGADLFHLLLELGDGYQLGDVSTDDTFAQLSIFVQRLVREDQRELFAWNPMQDERIFKVSAVVNKTELGLKQRIQITPISLGNKS